MIHMPPPELHDAFTAAAAKSGLPVNLLEALAYDASAFDPSAKNGDRKGLFGFTDPLCTAFAVSDPYNAAQAIEGACLALRDIVKNWSNFPAIFASWRFLVTVPHDPSKNLTVAQLAAARVATLPGAAPPSWPAEMRAYCARMLAFRYWFMNRGQPSGATVLEKLDKATAALVRANVGLKPAIRGVLVNTADEARAKFVDYQKSLWPDLTLGSLWAVWLAYRDAFDVAPVTTSDTPLPELIEPNWWRERLKVDPFTPTLMRTAEEIAKAAAEVSKAAKNLNDATRESPMLVFGGIAAVAALGVVIAVATRK
ncbi:MAG TPA: hypothetical protein VFZ66_24485 [Herpetosiphonaceae bacterium]